MDINNHNIQKDGIIDVNFTDIDEELERYSEYVHFKTGDVAKLLNEKDSTIRYWCEEFKDILNIEREGNNRKFTEENIKILRNIQYILREKNWKINQVKEYYKNKDVSIVKQKVEKEHDPMAIQALATALTIEIGSQLEEFKTQLVQQITNEVKENLFNQNEIQQQNQAELKDYIAITINEKLDTQLNDLKSSILTQQEQQEQQAKQRDEQVLTSLRQHMEERKQQYEESKQQEQNKSFWQKLFGK